MDINCSIDDMLQTLSRLSLSCHTMTPEDIAEWLDWDSRIRTHLTDLEPLFSENSHIDTVEEDTASTSNTEAAPTDREAGNAFDTCVNFSGLNIMVTQM